MEFVPTNLQAADSLTKFMKGGSEQLKARELLGAEDTRTGRWSPQAKCVASDRACVFRVCVCVGLDFRTKFGKL